MSDTVPSHPEGYLPRRTVPRGVLITIQGWQLKPYIMTAGDAEPPAELLYAALHAVNRDMPAPDTSPGAGWLLVHVARPAYFVTAAWWHDDVDLRQLYYRASFEQPGTLHAMPPFALACVWEFDVLVHERAAWIAHGRGRDLSSLDEYLADALSRP